MTHPAVSIAKRAENGNKDRRFCQVLNLSVMSMFRFRETIRYASTERSGSFSTFSQTRVDRRNLFRRSRRFSRMKSPTVGLTCTVSLRSTEAALDLLSHRSMRASVDSRLGTRPLPWQWGQVSLKVNMRLGRTLCRVISRRPNSLISDKRGLDRSPPDGLPEFLLHPLAVLHDGHVDEVDDDDAANIAQAKLARDLPGGLEVDLQHVFFLVRTAHEPAAVHVDGKQGLGVVQNQVAAALQPDFTLGAFLDFTSIPKASKTGVLSLWYSTRSRRWGEVDLR